MAEGTREIDGNSWFLAPDQKHSGLAFECIRDLKQTTAGLEGFWKTTTGLEGFWTKLQRMLRSLVAPPKGGPADKQRMLRSLVVTTTFITLIWIVIV